MKIFMISLLTNYTSPAIMMHIYESNSIDKDMYLPAALGPEKGNKAEISFQDDGEYTPYVAV